MICGHAVLDYFGEVQLTIVLGEWNTVGSVGVPTGVGLGPRDGLLLPEICDPRRAVLLREGLLLVPDFPPYR